MGALSCSDDPYKQVMDKYGIQLKEYVVKEKTKAFLFRSLSKLKSKVEYLAKN